MAYFISEKQYLASNENRSKYVPFRLEFEWAERTDIAIGFGHPLYTSILDIFIIKNISSVDQDYLIIPDGCIYMIFYGENQITGGGIYGVTDEIRKIKIEPGKRLEIIRFIPGVRIFFECCGISEITNRVIDIEDSVHNGRQLITALNKDISFVDKSLLISKLIRVRMNEDQSEYLINYCIKEMSETGGCIKVEELAKKTGFSERYIGKVFNKKVGVSPKFFSEIMRIQNSLKKLFDNDNKELLLNIALDCGYYDHAHMNRDYKKFLHCSAGKLKKYGFEQLDYDKVCYYLK